MSVHCDRCGASKSEEDLAWEGWAAIEIKRVVPQSNMVVVTRHHDLCPPCTARALEPIS